MYPESGKITSLGDIKSPENIEKGLYSDNSSFMIMMTTMFVRKIMITMMTMMIMITPPQGFSHIRQLLQNPGLNEMRSFPKSPIYSVKN